jgi:N-hydroxyarylamine O-acetyltransferase
VTRPRAHMLVRIDLPQGTYIADVGFGLLTLTAPLQLQPDLEQPTPHGLHRLVRIGEEFQLQVKLTDRWASIYQLSLQEQAASDWEVHNWFTATHPDSIFTNSLMAARPVGDLRYALFNDRLSIHYPDGTIERRIARDPSELASYLDLLFDIRLPSASHDSLKRFAKGQA